MQVCLVQEGCTKAQVPHQTSKCARQGMRVMKKRAHRCRAIGICRRALEHVEEGAARGQPPLQLRWQAPSPAQWLRCLLLCRPQDTCIQSVIPQWTNRPGLQSQGSSSLCDKASIASIGVIKARD